MAKDYFDQMDAFLAPQEENRFLSGKKTGLDGKPNLSTPIVPVNKLGTTFVEKGPNGQSVVQSMMSSIRKGTGSLQLALQTDIGAAMGGGISSISKNQRQAIKEAITSSEIDWQGLEMATSLNNVGGFDGQRGGFSEQDRHRKIQAMKDAIDFNADIGFGGGVDNVSMEFSRDIAAGCFQGRDKTVKFRDFEGYDENKDASRVLIDNRTGQAITSIQTAKLGGNGPTISVPDWTRATENGVGSDGVAFEKGDYVDAVGNKLVADANDKNFIMNRVPIWDEENSTIKMKQLDWQAFKKYANQRNKEENINLTPEVWVARLQLENQFAQQKAQISYHTQRYSKELEELKELSKAEKYFIEIEEGKSEDELMASNLMMPTNPNSTGGSLLPTKYKKKSEVIAESIAQLKRGLHYAQDTVRSADTQATNTWETMQSIVDIETYGKEKAFDSYAELALHALERSKETSKPIHVGPELGWPTSFGGHPDEFIEIIQGSRKKMVEKMKSDPYYKGYSEKKMKELAQEHIAGELDTSHLSMWYNHFEKTDRHESEESRLGRFRKWYMKQMDKMADTKVIGGIQIVDSITGDHRHLPIGQGKFPVVEAVKHLQKRGYKGSIASEGHEDEGIDPGSTQYSLWDAFGASMGDGYHFGTGGAGNSFGNVYGGNGGAAGYRMAPGYTFGAYSPSEEFKPWTGVPLE